MSNTEEETRYRAKELLAIKKAMASVSKLEKSTFGSLDIISQLQVGQTKPSMLYMMNLDSLRQMHIKIRQRLMFIRMMRLILMSRGLVRILGRDFLKLTPAQRKFILNLLEKKRQIWEFIMLQMRKMNEMAIARSNPNKTRQQLGLTHLEQELNLYQSRFQDGKSRAKSAWITRELDRHSFELAGAKSRGKDMWQNR